MVIPETLVLFLHKTNVQAKMFAMLIWHCSKVLKREIQTKIQQKNFQWHATLHYWVTFQKILDAILAVHCLATQEALTDPVKAFQTGSSSSSNVVCKLTSLSPYMIWGLTKIPSFNFACVILGNYSRIYSKPLEFLLPSILMNYFINPSFVCKGGIRTFSVWYILDTA